MVNDCDNQKPETRNQKRVFEIIDQQMYLSRRQLLLSSACLPWAGIRARAQDETTFKTEVKVVNVLASVRTKKGEIVRDLSQDDFSLTEDGRPQTIKYFARQSDLPLTLGLMVDTSMSQMRVLEAERTASFRFLDQVLRESKDQVFIMQFDMAMMLRQALTSSFGKLNDALAYVDTPSRKELEMGASTSKGTVLYDAVVKASNEIMKKQSGRKALLLLTDGVDEGSDATVADAVDAAQRADTLIYSILFSDPRFYLYGSPDGSRGLIRMAKETGGGFFNVSKKYGIDQIYASIQDELRSQYSLGYISDLPVRISEFRKIQLSVKQKGLVVQARDRYWAQR
jgi:VWFA-related protein